ncbi:MAG TPA: ATP-binding protein [Chloroflexia bacterium]|nr:ATP-binding protein [Chloroflexia bacterium]
MRTWLFACPFTDFARARQWRIINSVLLGAIGAFGVSLLLVLAVSLFTPRIGPADLLIMGGVFLLTLGAYGLHRAGHSTTAAWLVIVTPGPAMSFLSTLFFTPVGRTVVQVYLVIPILLISLFFSWRATVIGGGLILAGVAAIQALMPWPPGVQSLSIVTFQTGLLFVGVLVAIAIALSAAASSQVAWALDQLTTWNAGLEQTVATRTHELQAALASAVAARRTAEEAQTVAEAANAAKSQFLANMSHELRTPLNAILGYSDLLASEVRAGGTPDVLPDLTKIQTAGQHLIALITDILDLSKIEAGKMELDYQPLDLGELLATVVATVQPLVSQRGNTLLYTAPPALGPLASDATKLRQILLNLLSNAAKFTTQGTIELTVAPLPAADGAEAIGFTIRDTGIGMTEEQVARIFQEFYQAESSFARRYGGTGIGLALSQRLSRLLGGLITVTSTPGHGSTFTLTLPLTRRAPVAPPRAPVRVSGAPDAPRLLLIDDDPATCELIARYLVPEHWQVIAAPDGPTGLRLAAEQPPQVILLDIMLPGMDGWAVLSALKADPQLAPIPVVLESIVGNAALGFALGAVGYLPKPLRAPELIRVVQAQRAVGTLVDAEVSA